MTKLDIRRIITKYINREASSEEMNILYEWVKKGNNQEVFKKLVQADFLINYQNRSWETEEAFKQFLETLRKKKQVRPLYRRKHVWRYAASIAILVASAAYYFLYQDLQSVNSRVDWDQITLELNNGEIINLYTDNDTTVRDKHGAAIGVITHGVLSQIAMDVDPGAGENVLRVPYGKNLSVRLQDGSAVMLNSGSSLSYPSCFEGMDKREVHLKGEGFFEVTRNPRQPFIVHAQNMFTQVFGTVFNISAYDDDDATAIVLVEGSVGVGKPDGTLSEDLQMLKPSQKGSKAHAEDGFVIENVDVAPYISWTEGILTFENEEMVHIIKKLQRQFDVHIVNNYAELNERRFSGMFDEENIDHILRTIQAHTHFSYIKIGNTITIKEPGKQ